MTSSAGLLPFYGRYPTGYKPPASSGTSAGADAGGTPSTTKTASVSNEPVDVVDISNSRSRGGFTAAAGDLFAVGDLYAATAPAGGEIAAYKVALRGDPAAPGGRLMLGQRDVTDQVDFTPDEFARLRFRAGPDGSKQDLLVVAKTGTLRKDGTLSGVVDSPAVQITAGVTGTRSVNALGALLTQATGADADFVEVAQEANILTGFGGERPALSTVCSATIRMRSRIASPGMRLGGGLLPHLICSPPVSTGGGRHGADQHGDA